MPAPTLRPVLWLVAMAVFMQMLDTTIVNTALPSMAASLGAPPLQMQAVAAVYSLTLAILIPASGWLTDRVGARRVFATAIAVFTIGSLACALSRTVVELVASRVLQGVGGSMLLPVGRLAVLRLVPRQEFLAAMSFVTIPGLLGPLVGPTLGGWLVEVASWRWIFLINLPLGVVGTVAAWRLLPNLRRPSSRFDLTGYLVLAVGMAAVFLALNALADGAPNRGVTVLLLVFGLAALTSYWLHAARTAHPLFPPRLFLVHSFSVGVLGNLFARIGSGGMPYLIPLLLQVALGYSPMRAGMMLIPAALGGMFSKRAVVHLVGAFGYRPVLVGNTLFVGTTMASFALVQPGQSVWLHAVQFACFGAANSLQFTAMNTLALQDLEADLASSGNSLLSMVLMLSMSVGVVVAGGLLATFGAASGTGTLMAFRWTFVCVGLVTMGSAAIFAQLAPTSGIAEATVREVDAT